MTPSPRMNRKGIVLFVVLYTSSYVSSSISICVIVSSASERTIFKCWSNACMRNYWKCHGKFIESIINSKSLILHAKHLVVPAHFSVLHRFFRPNLIVLNREVLWLQSEAVTRRIWCQNDLECYGMMLINLLALLLPFLLNNRQSLSPLYSLIIRDIQYSSNVHQLVHSC